MVKPDASRWKTVIEPTKKIAKGTKAKIKSIVFPLFVSFVVRPNNSHNRSKGIDEPLAAGRPLNLI